MRRRTYVYLLIAAGHALAAGWMVSHHALVLGLCLWLSAAGWAMVGFDKAGWLEDEPAGRVSRHGGYGV